MRFEGNPYGFCLSIGVGREVSNTRPLLITNQIVVFVSANPGDATSFYQPRASLSLAINYIIDSAVIVATEAIDVEYLSPSDELLFLYLRDPICTIPEDNNHLIEQGALGYKLGILEACSCEPTLSIEVKFFCGFYYLGRLNRTKASYGGFSRPAYSKLLEKASVVIDGVLSAMSEMLLYRSRLTHQLSNTLLVFLDIKTQYSSHLDLEKTLEISLRNRTHKDKIFHSFDTLTHMI